MEFLDPRSYVYIDCEVCKGSGKDQKKRKRKCPKCGGSGKSPICKDCMKSICTCYGDHIMF